MPILVEEFEGRDVVLLTPSEELLTASLIEAVQMLAETYLAKRVVLDLRRVRSLVSGSLYPSDEPFAPLLSLYHRLKEGKRELVLCNLKGEMAEAFRVTRFHQAFESGA